MDYTSDEWLIAIIIWTVCAVAAWWIATTKNAPNPGNWAAMGLFFGPIGVLGAIAFAKPARKTQARRGPSNLVQLLMIIGFVGLLAVGAQLGLVARP